MWAKNKWNRKLKTKLREAKRSPISGLGAEECTSPQRGAAVAARSDLLLQQWDDAATRDQLLQDNDWERLRSFNKEAPVEAVMPCRVQLMMMVLQASDMIDSAATAEAADSQKCMALQRWVDLVQTRHHEVSPVTLTLELTHCLAGSPMQLQPGGLQAVLTDAELSKEVHLEGLHRKVLGAARVVSSHLDARQLRRDLAKAVDTDDFGAVAALSSELQKLCPTAAEVAAELHPPDEGSDDETVINPVESASIGRVTELQHKKCLGELDRCRARERVLEQEVSHMRRQLEGYQADIAALQGKVPQHSLARVGRAAIITDVSVEKEPYLGWLCTIVGQRENNPGSWILRLMWSHPCGDVIQLPAESFLVHPAVDRMKCKLAELTPSRQPRCTMEEVEELRTRIKGVASSGPSSAATTSGAGQASPTRRRLTRKTSESPVLGRVQGRGSTGSAEADSRVLVVDEVSSARRVRRRSSDEGRERLLDEAIEHAGFRPSSSGSSSSVAARILPAESAGKVCPSQPAPRGQREQAGWTQEEEARLTDGQKRYGNHWEVIRKKCNFMHRKGTQLREKFRNLDRAAAAGHTSE